MGHGICKVHQMVEVRINAYKSPPLCYELSNSLLFSPSKANPVSSSNLPCCDDNTLSLSTDEPFEPGSHSSDEVENLYTTNQSTELDLKPPMTKDAVVPGPLGLGLSRFLLMCRLRYELDLEPMNEMTILVEFDCSGKGQGCQMAMEGTL